MLTPDKVRYDNGVKVCEKIIPDNAKASKYVASWVQKGAPMKPGGVMKPIGITIHNTGDLKNVNDDAEQYTRATWPNCNMSGVVVHYYVDEVGAWQNLRENEPGWHAADGNGPGNTKTIAIECIMDGTGSAQDLKARDNAARLTAAIMHRHGFKIKDVYTHNHWMGLDDKIVKGARKNCPIHILPKWEEFKALVQKYLDGMQGGTKVTPQPTTTPSNGLSYEDIVKGAVYNFNGSKQYTSSNGAVAKNAKATTVKVTSITNKNAAHPIHVRSVDANGNFIAGVYGWVDIKDLGLSVPFLVKVKSQISIRRAPNSSLVSGTIDKPGIFTIIEEKDGWGKLKSNAGWINLKEVTKI